MTEVLIEESSVGDIWIEEDYSLRFQNILKEGKRYEPVLHSELEERFSSDDVFFDVGARFGYFSMLAKTCGVDVVAFEENSSFLKYLEENIEGEIIMGRVGRDVFLDEYSDYSPSVVLVDVEGDEVEVLRSSMDIIEKSSPDFYIEMHPWELDSADYFEIADILLGYSFYWADHRRGSEWNSGIGMDNGLPTYVLKAIK